MHSPSSTEKYTELNKDADTLRCLKGAYNRQVPVPLWQLHVGIPEAMLKMQFFLCNVSM